MKRSSTIFLKVVIVLIATIVLAFMIWFPQTEGRATNLDLISIYTDPFIVYLYIASIPFFGALFQALKLLGYIEQNKAFSQISVNALRNIKYCTIAFIGFIIPTIPYVSIVGKLHNDDYTGPVAMGLILVFASSVIATAAGVFQKLLQNAVDIKSENDLTV